MRTPGSKGAPSDKDLKSIRASSVKEGWQDEFADMVGRMKKSGRLGMPRSNYNYTTPEPKSKEELMSRLKELEAEFDPAYQQSDDYSFWKKQNDIASEISSIKRQLRQQDVAEGSLNEFASDDSGDDGYYKEYMRGYKDGKGYPEVVKSSKNREIWMTVTPKKPPLTEPYMRGWYDGKYGPSPGKDLINLDKLREQGVAEGLGKDIKRLATGKDVKSRAGQEIAKSQDASMKGDTKTSKKHFDRYDKLDKLANKEQGVAEGLDEASAAWQRKEGKNPSGGLNKKGIASYRRENPGSKLSMAVTTKPSKLKKGSKAWNRRKSFCARMGGMPGPMKDEKGRPTRKALSLRKWNC